MKILLAVDGSEYTKRMLDYVAAHEELLGPAHDYMLCTVVAPIPPHARRFLDRGVIESYYQEQWEEVLLPLQRSIAQHGWRVQTRHPVGSPPEMIAALAEQEKVDLIVMGTHGHTSLGNVILGSVATGVIARSPCPVLLVP
jgi:nucleotide-binding universal stress UspA family protein